MLCSWPEAGGLAVALLVLLPEQAPEQSVSTQVPGPSAEVEAREIAFARTMADRDLEAFLTFLSPEAIFFSGNEPIRGAEAIGKAWAPLFEGETAPFSWHPDVVEVLESGGLAMTSGPVWGPSGEEIGRFNSIWRRDPDGQWRVVFDKGS